MKKHNKVNIIIITIAIIIVCIFIGQGIYKNAKKNKGSNTKLEGSIVFVSNRTDKKIELEELINEFESIYPKVKVELELLGDAESILYRRASVESLPDVTLIPGAINVSEYDKYFLPLDDLGFNGDNIYNYAVGLGGDKKLYALTTSINWNGVIYNKKVFNKANINKIPTTNAEFFEICDKIMALGGIPIALNYKQPWSMSRWIDIIPYILNPNLENDIMSNSYNILDDKSPVFQSINFVREIIQSEYCEKDLINYEWQSCKEDIRDGNVAMFFGNSDLKYQLEDIGMNSEEIGMFPIMGSKAISVFGDYKFGIAKNTKYPVVAKEFLKFIFEEDRYVDAINTLSPLKESEKNKEFFYELESFNIPIDIHGELNIEDNVKDKAMNDNYVKSEPEYSIHEHYNTLKRISGLNYVFVQDYSICDNPDKMREDLNNVWTDLIK